MVISRFHYVRISEPQINVTQPKCDCGVTPSIEETFTLRRVRSLLQLLRLDDAEVDGNDVRRFDAKLELTPDEIVQLKTFLSTLGSKRSHKEYIGRLHDVNDILDKVITEVVPEEDFEFSDLVGDYTNKLKYYLPSSQDLFWAILFGGALGLFYLLKVGLPVWKWFLIILALSSVWHWGHLYKKAMLKKHVALMSSTQIPAECFKEKEAWWNFISGSTNQKCIEYHEALLVDPLWEVTPTMAVAETLVVFVMQPMEKIGLHLGKFFTALLSTQSWFTMIPVLVFAFVLFFLLFIMIFKYQVRLPFLMATFEPHTQPDNQSAQQVLILEQKVQELTQKLESQSTSTAAETRQLTSEVEPPPPKPINYEDPTRVNEHEEKISELEAAMKELKIAKVSAADVKEVVSLEATVQLEAEVVHEDGAAHDDRIEATVGLGSEAGGSGLEDVELADAPAKDEELVKDAAREDFEWVNTAASI